MEQLFEVTVARFHQTRPAVYVVSGYFPCNSIAGSKMSACADGTKIPLEVSMREGLAIRKRYAALGIGFEGIDREYDLLVRLPEDRSFHTLQVFQTQNGRARCIYRISGKELRAQEHAPNWYLESWREENGNVSLGGWAVSAKPLTLRVTDEAGQELPSHVRWFFRQDILDQYPELGPSAEETFSEMTARDFGFELRFAPGAHQKLILRIETEAGSAQCCLVPAKGAKNIKSGGVPLIKKAKAYIKRNGIRAGARRAVQKLSGEHALQNQNYMTWRRAYLPDKETLKTQRKTRFLTEPKISIAVPLYRTPHKYLRALIKSIQSQTYDAWELCFSDGSGKDASLHEILSALQAEEPRIRFCVSDVPLGISENTNRALSLATGDYVAFADHDDLLAEDALYEFVRAINETPDAMLFYSDEDKVSMDGRVYFEPHFKTDFNMDLLTSMNYFCHLVMVRRDLLSRVGKLDPAFDGAQDYDFVLRCVDEIAARAEASAKNLADQTCQMERVICHIPRALYHWRSHQDSTAENPESKRYAFEAGLRAVQSHFARRAIPASVSMGQFPGLYRVTYHIPDRLPKVSVIIPNKDHVDDLDRCLRSLRMQDFENLEILVAENNSADPETFAYYQEAEADWEKVRVLTWEKEFNFSLINNFAAQEAHGDYLLFLNNDTEMLRPDCIRELLGSCLRREVGAVGARLYYPDHTIQHAGVILGYGGLAGHAFAQMDGDANGYFSRIICQSDLSAVTAACMLVKREAFDEVGGFEGALRVAFNDVDFCLKLRDAGYLIVYNPFAELIHSESKSRGYEDTPEKVARFNREADLFLKRHLDVLRRGDPYYNPNLSLNRDDFSLK